MSTIMDYGDEAQHSGVADRPAVSARKLNTEFVAIVGIGVSILLAVFAQAAWLDGKIERQGQSLSGNIERLGAELRLEIRSEIRAVRSEIGDVRSELRSELRDVRSDISDLRSEISDVRSELRDVRSEISDVRSEISDVREELGALRDDLGAKIEAVQAGQALLGRRLAVVESHVLGVPRVAPGEGREEPAA